MDIPLYTFRRKRKNLHRCSLKNNVNLQKDNRDTREKFLAGKDAILTEYYKLNYPVKERSLYKLVYSEQWGHFNVPPKLKN